MARIDKWTLTLHLSALLMAWTAGGAFWRILEEGRSMIVQAIFFTAGSIAALTLALRRSERRDSSKSDD